MVVFWEAVKFFWLILAFCSTSLWGVVLVVRGTVKISAKLVTCSVWWSGSGHVVD